MSRSDQHSNGGLTSWRALSLPSRIVALSASGSAGEAPFAQAVAEPADWDIVVWLAARQRAISPVFRRLGRTQPPSLRAETLDRLQRLALVGDFQLDHLHQRLVSMLRVLRAASIDVVLLKGAGLAYSVYAKPADRPMADLDLLVRAEHAHEAWTLALANGWVRRGDVPVARSYEEHQHLPPLEDNAGLQTGLEIHTALFTGIAPFDFTSDEVWDQARRITVGGESVLVPSPVHQLVHCCLHFAWSHEMMFGAWRTLRDVERLVSTGEIDWAEFVALARRSRGGSCCYWTLQLAQDLALVQVPADVLAALAPRLPRWVLRALAQQFAQRAFSVPADDEVNSVSLSRMLWSLGVRPGAYGHGGSRPWLDNDEPVVTADESDGAESSTVRRLMRKSVGVLRIVGQVIRA